MYSLFRSEVWAFQLGQSGFLQICVFSLSAGNVQLLIDLSHKAGHKSCDTETCLLSRNSFHSFSFHVTEYLFYPFGELIYPKVLHFFCFLSLQLAHWFIGHEGRRRDREMQRDAFTRLWKELWVHSTSQGCAVCTEGKEQPAHSTAFLYYGNPKSYYWTILMLPMHLWTIHLVSLSVFTTHLPSMGLWVRVVFYYNLTLLSG